MPILPLNNSVKAVKFRVKFKDIFNIKEFYRALHEWLIEYGWSGADSDRKSVV